MSKYHNAGKWSMDQKILRFMFLNILHRCHNFPAGSRQAAKSACICEKSLYVHRNQRIVMMPTLLLLVAPEVVMTLSLCVDTWDGRGVCYQMVVMMANLLSLVASEVVVIPTFPLAVSRDFSWCQLCYHWWHQSLRQPLVPQVKTKLASWQLPISSFCSICSFCCGHWSLLGRLVAGMALLITVDY